MRYKLTVVVACSLASTVALSQSSLRVPHSVPPDVPSATLDFVDLVPDKTAVIRQIYEDSYKCTKPHHVIDAKAKPIDTAKVRAGVPVTIKVHQLIRSSLSQQSFCANILTFTPQADDHYRAVSRMVGDKCLTLIEHPDANGEWTVLEDVVARILTVPFFASAGFCEPDERFRS